MESLEKSVWGCNRSDVVQVQNANTAAKKDQRLPYPLKQTYNHRLLIGSGTPLQCFPATILSTFLASLSNMRYLQIKSQCVRLLSCSCLWSLHASAPVCTAAASAPLGPHQCNTMAYMFFNWVARTHNSYVPLGLPPLEAAKVATFNRYIGERKEWSERVGCFSTREA